MNIASCMTRDPLTVTPDATLRAALAVLDEAGVRHLPVVEDGALVGILSDRELLERTGHGLLGDQADDGATVAEVMHRDPVTASPDDLIVSAVSELSVHGVGCLPVVDGGQLVGIVSETDFMRLLVQVSELGLAPAGADPEVGRIATLDVATLERGVTLEGAAQRMRERGCRHLPVIDDAGALVGMVSDRDLRRAQGAGVPASSTIDPLMSAVVHSVDAGDRLSLAARKMLEHRVSALPVTGRDELGILTTTDVLEHALGALGG